jgi:hypothetical protein
LGELNWSVAWTRLSLGLEGQDLKIEGAGNLERLQVPHFRLLLEPMKLLLGKIPLRVELREPTIRFAPRSSELDQGVGTEANVAIDSTAPHLQLPTWTRFLRLQLVLENASVNADPKAFGQDPDLSRYRLEKTNFEVNLSGFPGSFSLEAKTVADLLDGSSNALIEGPVSLEAGGYFQLVDGRPVGLKVDSLDADFDSSQFSIGRFVDKPSGSKLKLESEMQILLDRDFGIKSVGLEHGDLVYENVHTGVSGSFDRFGNKSFHWNLPTTEVSDLHLPVPNIHQVPFSGMLESSGTLDVSRSSGVHSTWKLSLNNFRVETRKMGGWFDKSSSGAVAFSFVSEGEGENGRYSSPRTEFQLDGTDAQLELLGGRFIKPEGDKLEILLKAQSKDDRLSVKTFNLKLHTMELEGRALVASLSSYLQARPTPVHVELHSNRVDLVRWSSYFPYFRRLPLEGVFEFAGMAEGTVFQDEGDPFSGLSWRVDRASLSKIRGAFEKDSPIFQGPRANNIHVSGPFAMDFHFQGRGQGATVHRASLLAQLDLTKVGFLYKDSFLKPIGVPLTLDVSAEQTRNELTIRRGSFVFDQAALGFSGDIVKGSNRSSIDLTMAHPIDLNGWRPFFLKLPKDFPLSGKIQWQGEIGFDRRGVMEGDLDWKTFALEGMLHVRDLACQLGGFGVPLTKGHGDMLVGDGAITIPDFRFEIGGAKVAYSGVARALKAPRRARSLTLSQLVGGSGWDFSSQLTLDRLTPALYAELAGSAPESAPKRVNMTADPGPTLGQWLHTRLDSPFFKTSQLRLRVRAGQGLLGEAPVSDFNAVANWKNGTLRVEPLGFRIHGGQVTGSASLEAQNYYERKDAPELSLALKLKNIRAESYLEALHPELKSSLTGVFDGQLAIAARGFERDEIAQSLAGRLQGRLSTARLPALSTALQAKLDDLVNKSEARDFIRRRARNDACVSTSFNANIDAQVRADRFELQRSAFVFGSGTVAAIRANVDSKFALTGEGEIIAGSKCVGEQVRACLGRKSEATDLSFGLGGQWPAPTLDLDTEDIGRAVAACMRRRIAGRARREIASELKDPSKRRQEEKTREKLRRIFQRSGP